MRADERQADEGWDGVAPRDYTSAGDTINDAITDYLLRGGYAASLETFQAELNANRATRDRTGVGKDLENGVVGRLRGVRVHSQLLGFCPRRPSRVLHRVG